MSLEDIVDPDVVTASVLACGTLLVYDYLCLLDQEVSFVWTQKWTFGSVLFVLNRYLPFIDTFLSLQLLFEKHSPEGCMRKFTAVTWLIAFGIILSEFILIIRTYAIWSRERYVLITLCIAGTITMIPAVVVTALEIQSLKYIPNQLGNCVLGHAGTIIIFAYILLTCLETTIAVLTGVKAYRHMRYSQEDWISEMYSNGLYFYAYLLIISLANILVPILGPPKFANWLATPQRVMHSVLSTRVLLLILKQRPSVRDNDGTIYSTGIPTFAAQTADHSASNATTSEGTSMLDMDFEMQARENGANV